MNSTILPSIKVPDKLDRVTQAFAKKENAQIVEYARKVIRGLILIYKDAQITGDKNLNLILGRAPFVRDVALAIVMNHDVYNDLRQRGYTVEFYYDPPQKQLEGLTMYMDKPPEDDTQKVMEVLEEHNAKQLQVHQ